MISYTCYVKIRNFAVFLFFSMKKADYSPLQL